MQNHFGIGIREEAIAFFLQAFAQLNEVVYLAVVSDPDRAVRVAHRHVAAGSDIQDRQPPASQSHVTSVRKTLLPPPGVVWPAMRLHRGHARRRYVTKENTIRYGPHRADRA